MATITTRANFKQYCLRRLGFPVIEINIDDDQLEDRIDDAIQYWQSLSKPIDDMTMSHWFAVDQRKRQKTRKEKQTQRD